METFTPSLNWGDEVVLSLLWIAKVWALAAVGALAVGYTIIRRTVWGRQFWRVTGDYFTGRASVPVWAMLAVLLLSVVVSVRIDVLLSYWGNDLYTSVQVAFQGMGSGDQQVKDSGQQGFWFSMTLFWLLATIHVVRATIDLYLMQRFILRWRIWLTRRLVGDWLDGRAYYRGRFVDRTIDNPDQRIQLDIDIFTTGYGPTPNQPNYGSGSLLYFGAIEYVIQVASFTAILWTLSGGLDVFGWFTLPKALFWIVVVYVAVSTVVGFWIGRPLIRFSYRNEVANAAFRYALVRLRDSAEAVGFYRGERAERAELQSRFGLVVDNYRHYLRRSVGFMGWDSSANQAIVPLPYLLQAPRMFAGAIQFGDVIQSNTAFAKIYGGLSYFRTVYDYFASYRAAIIRLHGFVVTNEKARALPELATEPSLDGAVELRAVEVRTPDGALLVDTLDLRLGRGETMVITGPSGAGKTTLLRSLAQLWPYATGTLKCPGGENETMFLSQLPYVPLGDLRAVVSYPNEAGAVDDALLRDALTAVSLSNYADRLDDTHDWATVLSPGEQQRLAFARVLLTAPKAVFLDESTSALDEGLETMLYGLIRAELPDLVVVTVSHRSGLGRFHARRLELTGDRGRWRLDPVTSDT